MMDPTFAAKPENGFVDFYETSFEVKSHYEFIEDRGMNACHN